MSLKLGSNDTAILAGSSVVKQMLLGSSPKFAAPVLDHVPGAAAAYSLRRLSNAYTGPVVKVRRSSDSTTADFTAAEVVDGTLAAWVGAGDGFVHTWYDQSGNARHATQATAGYQPKIVASGVVVTEGGKAAVQFDGVDDLMTIAGEISLGGDFSIFGLFTRPTSTVQYVFRKGNGSYSTRIGSTSATGSIDILLRSASGEASVNTQEAGSLHAMTAQRAGSLALRLNGALSGAASMASVDSSNSPLGEQGLGGQASGAFFYNGKIQEFLIYPSDVSASRELAEGEIAWHYGLQSKLPYNHAYAPQALGGASQTVPTDSDAIAYLAAVAAADGSAVERSVAIAIDDFVKGLKADGLWSAIGSACVLAGARTVAGALVPLKGAAPTGYNWTASDYSRSLGLKGDGSTKYIDSNRSNDADGQDDQHVSVFSTVAFDGVEYVLGRGTAALSGTTTLINVNSDLDCRSRNGTAVTQAGAATIGLIGFSRQNSDSVTLRGSSQTFSKATTSQLPAAGNIHVFGTNGSGSGRSDARLAFYSIGSALDLALLDARVSALMTAIGAAL